MRRIVILCLFVFVTQIFPKQYTCKLDFSGPWRTCVQALSFFDPKEHISSFSLQSDLSLSSYEYDYIYSDKKPSFLWSDVYDCLERCYHMHAFGCAHLIFSEEQSTLSILLERAWKFRRIRLHGPLISRDRYRRFYSLEPGDLFDEQKHDSSVDNIKKYLHDIGFLNASVDAQIFRSPSDYTVTVDLSMHPGQRYHVRSTTLIFEGSAASEIDVTFRKKLRGIASEAVQGEFFTQERITTLCDQLRHVIIRKGFWDVCCTSRYSKAKKGSGVHVEYVCRVNKMRRVHFKGNSFFSKKQLHAFLETFGSALHLIPGSVLRHELLQHYQEKGFCQACVSVDETCPSSFTFLIDEGPRARVCEVIVQGAQACDSLTLKKRFFSSCVRHYYDSAAVKQALDECARFYIEQGFWDVTVSHECCVSSDGRDCTIVVRVTEGTQRFLGSMSVHGDIHSSWQECADEFDAWQEKFMRGVGFSPLYLQECSLWFRRYFRQHGYRTARVSPVFGQGDPVDVAWDIKGQAKPCRFGQTVLSGCGVINKDILLRECAYQRGDVWDQHKLGATCDRLRALGVFDRVVVYPALRDGSVDTGDVDEQTIVIKYRQADKYELRPRVGFQTIGKWGSMTGGSLRGGGSLVCRNIFQRGGIARLDAEITRFRRDINARYRVPWLFGYPIRTEFIGYSVRFDQFVTPRSKRVLYKAHRDGCAINLGTGGVFERRNMSFGCEMSGISSLAPDLGELLCFAPNLINKKRLFLFCEPMYVLDARDNPVSPNYGSFTLLTAKAMVPVDGIKESFVRFLGVQSVYFPIYKAVVAARFRVGHVFNRNFCCVEPPDRFYLGGGYSLRGYEMDMAPPLRCFSDGKSTCCVPFGGSSMLNANIELRLPLPWNLRGVLFTDMGYLSQNAFADIKPHSVIGASGFGLRYATPIGMLRFDIGWKWKPDAWSQARCAWFLTIGDMF